MKIVCLVALSCLAPLSFAARAQQPAAAMVEGASASTLLRPGLTGLAAGLQTVKTNRWKLSQAARDEVENNVGSLHRDLDTTLPDLLAAADARPASLALALPVSRNVDALYDVLLRTLERARTAAPADQAAALDGARVSLDQARRSFDAFLQATAAAQEQALRQVQNVPAPPPCVPAPVTRKKRSN